MLLSKETKTSKGGSQVSSQSVQLSLLEATGSPSITQVGLSTHMVLWISPVIQGVYWEKKSMKIWRKLSSYSH